MNKSRTLADYPKGVGDIVEHGFLGQQTEILEDNSQAPTKKWDLPARYSAQILTENVDFSSTRSLLFKDET